MNINALDYPNFPPQVSAQLYANDMDRKNHMAYMASIAAERHKDISEVLPFYENVLGDLRGQARVHDFLSIFVAKKVVEQLNRLQ